MRINPLVPVMVAVMFVAVIAGDILKFNSPVHAQTRPVCFTLPNFDKYVTMTPTNLTKTARTHVAVMGTVALTSREEDGDMHIAVTDGITTIVAECIPEMPCPAVLRGDKVTVWGISRFDKQHKWYEVHPVEMMDVNVKKK